MADNRPSELKAENYISYNLLKYNFKISKPSFDENGTDLLIIDNINLRVTKILKVQSKLRTISKGNRNSVEVNVRYVTENFVLFLYVSSHQKDGNLYTFFSEDLRAWNQVGNHFKLSEQSIRSYTSIIIDGIFLFNALKYTISLYTGIWPEKVLKRPSLKDIIYELLSYNRFQAEVDSINCIVFLSDQHYLESLVNIPNPRNAKHNIPGVKLSIHKSESIISFEVLKHLERIVNAENVILVADDASYERPLNTLVERGVDLIVIKHSEDSRSRMYPDFRWADITSPLGRALGLSEDQL